MSQRSFWATRFGFVIDGQYDIGARRRIAQIVTVADKALSAKHVNECDILHGLENCLLLLTKIGSFDSTEAGSAH